LLSAKWYTFQPQSWYIIQFLHTPDAIVHDLVTEVYHIIKGRGILIVGGTLDSPVKIPSDDPIVRKITGPSSTSKSIIGGKPYEVGPGYSCDSPKYSSWIY
jgi:hypothetical protein